VHLAILILLLTLGAAGCDHAATPPYPSRIPPPGFLSDPARRAEGEKLFRRLCATCHGHTDEGRSPRADFFIPPAPDFRSPAYRNRDPAYLYWRIEEGKMIEPYLSRGSVMPAWGTALKEESIWALVAYLQSRSVE